MQKGYGYFSNMRKINSYLTNQKLGMGIPNKFTSHLEALATLVNSMVLEELFFS
jgi:hypothetical protein